MTDSTKKSSVEYKIGMETTVVIRNALQIVANRLVNPRILQNMYDICGISGYDLALGVWDNSQLEHNDNYDGPHDVLRYQLMCPRVKGEKGEFPTIHIYPIYERTKLRGEGRIGCVSCIPHGSQFRIEDEFQVSLDRYQLGAYGISGSDPIIWVGIIVHEMLHNLGHDHALNDYSGGW